MFRRRGFIMLTVVAGVFVAGTLPAQAGTELMKKKSFTAPHGRQGIVKWYQSEEGGKITNYVKVSSKDTDGGGGKCTETWLDYSTKPWRHYNPGVVVNCTGKWKTRSWFHVNNYHGIRGIGVVVCEVPDTNGRIYRSKENCEGNLGAMYLWSGKRYSQFAVKATRFPNGVLFYKF